MNSAINILREKLHNYINQVEDKKIKAFYTLVESDIVEEENIYTEEFKAELDKRYADYLNDGILISREDANEQIAQHMANFKK